MRNNTAHTCNIIAYCHRPPRPKMPSLAKFYQRKCSPGFPGFVSWRIRACVVQLGNLRISPSHLHGRDAHE